jgi:hypothetical protein
MYGLFVQPNGGQHRTLSHNKNNNLRRLHLSCVLAGSVGEMSERSMVNGELKAGKLMEFWLGQFARGWSLPLSLTVSSFAHIVEYAAQSG